LAGNLEELWLLRGSENTAQHSGNIVNFVDRNRGRALRWLYAECSWSAYIARDVLACGDRHGNSQPPDSRAPRAPFPRTRCHELHDGGGQRRSVVARAVERLRSTISGTRLVGVERVGEWPRARRRRCGIVLRRGVWDERQDGR